MTSPLPRHCARLRFAAMPKQLGHRRNSAAGARPLGCERQIARIERNRRLCRTFTAAFEAEVLGEQRATLGCQSQGAIGQIASDAARGLQSLAKRRFRTLRSAFLAISAGSDCGSRWSRRREVRFCPLRLPVAIRRKGDWQPGSWRHFSALHALRRHRDDPPPLALPSAFIAAGSRAST
jgi:hypothetical protein